MSENKFLEKNVVIHGAKYVESDDAIAIIGVDSSGVEVKHAIHSSVFSFRADMNKREEMEKTAALMVGKSLKIQYDPMLEEKMKEIADNIAETVGKNA